MPLHVPEESPAICNRKCRREQDSSVLEGAGIRQALAREEVQQNQNL